MNLGTAVASAVASAIVLVAVISFFTRSRKRRIPNKWTEVGHVSHLRVYPLKSGKGIACESLTCTESGVAVGQARDRMFLVVDSHGKCISGREYPRITQIAAEVSGSRLKLSGLEINPLEVDIPSTGVPVRLRIWGASAEGLDCGRKASEWLTKYLGSETPLRLLYRGENVAAKDYIPHMKKLLEMTGTATYKTDTMLVVLVRDGLANFVPGIRAYEKVIDLDNHPESIMMFRDPQWKMIHLEQVEKLRLGISEGGELDLRSLPHALLENQDKWNGENEGLFSDTFSYHLISESSVRDLNSRMGDVRVTAFHFRPNIVVSGEKLIPFEEDRWKWLKIGDVVFQLLAPCMRCSFTRIDPETGARLKDDQPVSALKRYRIVRDQEIRKIVHTPTMGIYLGLRAEGVISIGDVVSIPEASS